MTDLFHSSKPIYEQIGELIKKRIVRGELSAGDKLLSVREMALEVNVNPNTVQRTYRELESMDIAKSRRGQGTFVTEDLDVIRDIREEMTKEVLSNFVNEMTEMGYTIDEIKQGLDKHLRERGEKQ